jgi:hypothetical protein
MAEKQDESKMQNERNTDEFRNLGPYPPPVRNADNALLGPIGLAGYVPHINGPGAQEVPDFHPTKYELIILAKHWVEEAINIEYGMFVTQVVGSWDTRERHFAWFRVERIHRLLGEKVDKAIRRSLRGQAQAR